jgi:rod shape-determining protein MreC
LLRILKNKVFILILVTIIIFIVMGVSSTQNSSANWISNIASIPLSPVQKFLSFTGQKVEEGLSFFSDIKSLKEENEVLKARVSELERENRELIGLKEKNEELRKALKLKDNFESYDLVGANVIAKDPGNWFNVFKIDVGKKDGITNNAPVLTNEKGLVGRVQLSDLTSSRVVSLIDEESVVSATISKPGGGHVIIRGDFRLKEEGMCRMDYLPFDADVEVGDVVETSGLGGIYPKGIIIGKIVQIGKTNSEMDRYAIVEPVVDFKRIEEVLILKSRK